MKKVKRILLLGLMVVFAFVTFGVVDAREYATVDQFLNDLPNEIPLNINDTDLFKETDEPWHVTLDNGMLDEVRENINNSYELGEHVVIGDKKYDWFISAGYNCTSVRKALILVFEAGTTFQNLKYKEVKLKYTNDSKYNAQDEAYVKNAIKGLSFDSWISKKQTGEDTEKVKKAYTGYIKSIITDPNLQLKGIFVNNGFLGEFGDIYFGIDFGIAYNGVIYETISGGVSALNEYIVPDTIKDTQKAYTDYALAQIKKDYDGLTIKNIKYVGNSLYMLEDSFEDSFYIIIRKNNVSLVMDNVVLNTFNVEPEGKVLASSSATYKEMNSKMAAKGYQTIGAYDLKVTSGVVPSNSVLTFSVDTKYNGQKVLVLCKNGTKYQEILSTVKNGKISINVSNLYPTMIGVAKNVPITGVKINQKNPTVVIKKTTKLTATITPSNTTQSRKVTWSTSNKKIATVDKNGVVKGIKAGTVNITVKTLNGKTATVKVTVKKATPIKSVKLNKKTLKLELNKSATVKATINPSSTTDSKKLTWSSSNKKVAVVDKNGKITAKAAGTAKITVKTSNGKKATVKVTVSKINAKKAKISAIKNQVQTGKTLKPAVTVKLGKATLKNGRDYTVSYKNNKNAGKATVTVKFKGNYTGSSKKTTFLIIPSKVNIKNPSTAKKSITVKYLKVSGAKTYQIAYRLKGTKKWSYATSKSASKKISKLTSGKEYEVIVRAGIKNGSKTLYGAWSNTKVIKVK